MSRVLRLAPLLAAVLALLPSCFGRKAAPVVVDACQGPASWSLLEVRDGTGNLELALRAPPSGATVLCDDKQQQIATLVKEGDRSSALRTRGGEVLASIASRTGEDPELSANGIAFRLHDEAGLLRILDPQGVPVGQVGRQGERAVTFDPGGRPLATAEPAQENDDRRAIRAPDGAVRHLLIGLHDDRAAAAFALDRLPAPAQLLLARFLDGKTAPPPAK